MNFYYIHVPKTGGTSLRDIFLRNLPEGEVLFVNGEKEVELYTEDRLKTLTAIGGHLPLWKFMATPAGISYPCVKFAVLRDPIDRLLSLYNYLSVSKHPDHVKYSGLSFEDFVSVFAKSKPPALHMCYSFSGKGDFETSRANILKHNVAIYSLEDIGDLLVALSTLLGVDAELSHLNKSQKTVTHADTFDLDIGFLEADVELYAAYRNGDLPRL